ncbi:MAG TPA: cytochrome c biogenesis protein CcdA [Thermoanaerobaculia bacterium]|nr:cytochrome c biogenesis protein CcdA [Thermoanaerobaculia bacterium]
MKSIVMRLAQLAIAFGLCLSASHASAQLDIGGLPRAEKNLVRLTLEVDPLREGELRGVVVAEIAGGWHINSWKPIEKFFIPTVLTLEGNGIETTTIDYPAHLEKKFDFAGGNLAVYEGTIRIPFAGRADPESSTLTAKLRYQACNDNICLPPTSVVATAMIGGAGGGGAAAVGDSGKSPSTSRDDTATQATERIDDMPPVASESDFTLLSNAPPPASSQVATPGGAAAAASLFNVGSTFAAHGLLLTLAIVFIAGLALNLTPCVYPLIPITLAFFSAQSGERRMQRVALSSTYVLGLALTYSALGVFSALSGRMFGAWLQSPAVLIGFAVLMIVLAASMFGLYEIRVPHVLADRAGARGGYAGALSMGLLVGIVAAPCVGPVVISLVALVSQLGSPLVGFLLFFFLALGLGVPYLILGIFSSGLSAIPRSGAWMDQVKRAMGFVLVAMAFYFVRPITGDTIYARGVAASLILGALFLFFAGRKSVAGRGVRIGAALVLLVAGTLFAIPSRQASDSSEWKKYDEALLTSARSGGQPVVIDFYADWCLPCKELDAKTFSHPLVTEESRRFVKLKADLTVAGDPRTEALSQQYGIIGVPTIVFLDSNGHELEHLRLTGFENARKFLARLKNVQ